MDTFAEVSLAVLLLVIFNNAKAGTLGPWLKAKFTNSASPIPKPAAGANGPAAPSSNPPTFASFTTGGWSVPTGGVITGHFGDARPANMGVPAHKHEGIDFGVPVGTVVHAAKPGKVTYAGASAGYGLRIDIDHGDGWSSRYAHLSRLEVSIGQVVSGGAEIAKSGNTGESTGPHLHFEIRHLGVAVDPAPFLLVTV